MSSQGKNILIGVDASDHSFEAIRYVGRLMPAGCTRINLFHVMNPIPESFYDFESLPTLGSEGIGFDGWEIQQRQTMEAFMERARELFLSLGFAATAISTTIRTREVGVARDILKEAKSGYDALVIGRRGVSPLKDLILGSIANKLVTHLADPPVWVIGGQSTSDKVLVAMDSSEGARRALEYVHRLFGRAHPDLLLLHVTRGHEQLRQIPAGDDLQREWLHRVREEFKRAEQVMQEVFENCIGQLARLGADTDRIQTKIVPGVYSRAAAIYGEAVEGDYGTMVMGRRGLSRIDEFFMGRVSNKVLQLSGDRAVWIVQ